MDRPITVEALLEALAPWDAYGPWINHNGWRLWGRVGDGPQKVNGWLHDISPPPDPDEFAVWISQAPAFKGFAYPVLWPETPSLHLFQSLIMLCGLRLRTMELHGDIQISCIEHEGDAERHFGKAKHFDGMCIGRSRGGGRMAQIVEQRSGPVFALDRQNKLKPVAEWPSFNTFFWSAIDELNAHWAPGNDYVPSWLRNAVEVRG